MDVKCNYVLIHYVQTNVNYLPLKYPQNRYNEAWVDRMRTLTLLIPFFFLKIHFKRKLNTMEHELDP